MPFYIRGGVGPIRYSKRISRGRRRSRGSQSSGGAGCMAVVGISILIAALFWPFIYLHGTAKWAVGIPWLLLITVVGVLIAVGSAKQRQERQQQEAQRAAEYQAELERRQEEERLQRLTALEESKRTGWYELDDGQVPAYHGVRPNGEMCHHRHRTPQAAAECRFR